MGNVGKMIKSGNYFCLHNFPVGGVFCRLLFIIVMAGNSFRLITLQITINGLF